MGWISCTYWAMSGSFWRRAASIVNPGICLAWWVCGSRTKIRLSLGGSFFLLVDRVPACDLSMEEGAATACAYVVGGLYNLGDEIDRVRERPREGVLVGSSGTESGGVTGVFGSTVYGVGGRGLPRIYASKCRLATRATSSLKALNAFFICKGRAFAESLSWCSSSISAAWANSWVASEALVVAALAASCKASWRVDGDVVFAVDAPRVGCFAGMCPCNVLLPYTRVYSGVYKVSEYI